MTLLTVMMEGVVHSEGMQATLETSKGKETVSLRASRRKHACSYFDISSVGLILDL